MPDVSAPVSIVVLCLVIFAVITSVPHASNIIISASFIVAAGLIVIVVNAPKGFGLMVTVSLALVVVNKSVPVTMQPEGVIPVMVAAVVSVPVVESALPISETPVI